MQQAVFMGEPKTIVVWQLDRLSRNQRDGINTQADGCEKGIPDGFLSFMCSKNGYTLFRALRAS